MIKIDKNSRTRFLEKTAMDDQDDLEGGEYDLTIGDGDSDDEFQSSELRHRHARTVSTPVVSSERRQFVETSEMHEKIDRDERCCFFVVVAIIVCISVGGVALKYVALTWIAAHPTPAATGFRSDRYVQLKRGSWSEFESTRSRCTRPTVVEFDVWASTGETCSKGACLNLTDLLKTLEARATLDIEAYSTMGKTSHGAPLPCACAMRDDAGAVHSYLDPKLKDRRGDLFEAMIEFDLFEGHVVTMIVPQIATVSYRAWPSGDLIEMRVEGSDAVQWTASLFILGDNL